LGDIGDVAKKNRWSEVLPQQVLRGVSFDGKVVAVPITMHGVNWMWFNRKVLERAKVAVPNNWDEMMAAAEKIKAAGFIPFAASSQPWLVNWLYGNILAGVGGRAVYERFAASDKSVFHTPAGLKALEILGQIRRYADDSAANRTWIASAHLLLNEKAAFQFIGDWAKSEFRSAGKPAAPSGGDIGCMLTPGTGDYYLMMGDVLALPAGVKSDVPAEQKRLAEVAMSPQVQVQVALAKGSLPFRSDVNLDGFDDCAKLGMKVFSKPNGPVASTFMTQTNEVNGAITDVLAKYWAQPNTPAKQVADSLVSAVSRAQ
jgi:glucose/mannose transport system substrate-binding protein